MAVEVGAVVIATGPFVLGCVAVVATDTTISWQVFGSRKGTKVPYFCLEIQGHISMLASRKYHRMGCLTAPGYIAYPGKATSEHTLEKPYQLKTPVTQKKYPYRINPDLILALGETKKRVYIR
ncbi:hypothetical protein G7K_3046-t1 [Saitoella complicata NRRL Y-17804]|uniref:Uncharacterized protein n=1 Tax=Saitoella complicata (strain BCRC 22490 / CBS 7301 / JCM 7358 / NBRC 10748 / NRRL Y-17804) TaxID=698492 RepID=A0A0E9NGF6_SAICN|nr:hypothetical protein G7K_3046-t1 [Saitoella complicata NRRL Y-17804]